MIAQEAALGRAVSGVLEETERRQSYEMALVASAARRLRPNRLFAPSAIPPSADTGTFQAVPAGFSRL
jgi:hypothetical protein